MFRKLSVLGVKARAVGVSKSSYVGARAMSEFYSPYPKTKGVSVGHYLVNAILHSDTHTVFDILESGVDAIFRAELVTYRCIIPRYVMI
jgi:hypothetical protein